MAKYVLWLWEFSVATQLVVCALLFLQGNFRRVPFFTAYVLSNLCQATLLFAAYRRFGYLSHPAAFISWISQGLPQLLRVLATTEMLRLVLKPYRGIWGLGWRLLGVTFVSVFSYALIYSQSDRRWFIALVDRGFHLAFGIALVACLLLIRYYAIPIHRAYKTILAGFCFYSCIIVLTSTVGKILIVRGISDFRTGWDLLTMGAFVAVLFAWGTALRVPLPEPEAEADREEVESVYWELSPRINERLRLLNEELYRFWKPEATRN